MNLAEKYRDEGKEKGERKSRVKTTIKPLTKKF